MGCYEAAINLRATPGKWELEQTTGIFTEQVIRPTGLLDRGRNKTSRDAGRRFT